MFKRLIAVILVALVGTLALSACDSSLSSTKTLHGEAAKTALTKVVADSIAEFKKSGGTEQITIGQKQFGLVYDPSAPSSKQAAVFDAATDGPSQYIEPSTVFLLSLDKLVASELFTNATYDFANSGFTVTGKKAILTVQIFENRVNGTLLKSVTAGGPTQATINNYGVNDIAKAKLDLSTPAPSATPAQ
jgi:type II secretory pathway pseudopilin PulG